MAAMSLARMLLAGAPFNSERDTTMTFYFVCLIISIAMLAGLAACSGHQRPEAKAWADRRGRGWL